MDREAVVFKGTREGLMVVLKEGVPFDALKTALVERLESGRGFFEGSRTHMTVSGDLSQSEAAEVLRIMREGYGLFDVKVEPRNAVRPFRSDARGGTRARRDRNEALPPPPDLAPSEERGDVWSRPERETMALFVHHTVRSGQRVSYPGDIVVLGDVNPGAEIVAGGNIIVMGNMRGLAHAGALGEERAIVAAFALQPMQLRIAGIIGRAPDSSDSRPSYPELARVENKAIVIQPYVPGKR